ncbi:K-box region and MADS-box transcription factor family protein [Tanacetum coccineum]
MKRIEDKNSRHVTFSKRKTGLFKKARHLSALCGVDFVVIVFSSHGKLYQPCSGTTDRATLATEGREPIYLFGNNFSWLLGKEGSESAKRTFVRLKRQQPIQYIQTGSPLGSATISSNRLKTDGADG